MRSPSVFAHKTSYASRSVDNGGYVSTRIHQGNSQQKEVLFRLAHSFFPRLFIQNILEVLSEFFHKIDLHFLEKLRAGYTFTRNAVPTPPGHNYNLP